MSNNTLIGLISSGSILLPVASGIANRSGMKKRVKPFFYFILFTALIESFLSISTLYHVTNIFAINLISLVEFLFLPLLLAFWIWPRLDRRIAVGFCVGIFGWWVYTLSISGIHQVDLSFSLAEKIVLISLSGMYLIRIIQRIDLNSWQDSSFWITSGLLFYCASTVLLDLSEPYAYTALSNILFQYYVIIHSSVNVFCNLVFAIGLSCRK